VASIGPLVEELLFRGVLLSALLRRLRTAWAVLASAVLFALVHLPELHWLWYALPNLALLGVALAWLRLRSGSLWPAVIAHACNNLLAMVALFASLHHPG
jgi:membrane protease YdiL (CAAX protease family)